MPYLLAIFLVMLIGVFFGFSKGHTETPKSTARDKPAIVSETESMRQAEVKERLMKLAKDPLPTELSKGAMCYSMTGPPNIDEYVCPKCGEKTLYTGTEGPRSADNTDEVREEIVACRRILKEIEGLDVALDESQFCAKCTPDLREVPKIILVVHYEGREEPHRVEGVTSEDLEILKEFLDGKDKHKGDYGIETPLKDYTERLEELLGVKIEEHGDKKDWGNKQ